MTNEDPLKQIKEKRYFEKYISTPLNDQNNEIPQTKDSEMPALSESETPTLSKVEIPALSEAEVFIIGIVFDPKKRNITDFIWEMVS